MGVSGAAPLMSTVRQAVPALLASKTRGTSRSYLQLARVARFWRRSGLRSVS